MTDVSISTYLIEVIPQFIIIFTIQSIISSGRIKWPYVLTTVCLAGVCSLLFGTIGEMVFGILMYCFLRYRQQRSSAVSFVLLWDFYMILINLIALLTKPVANINANYFNLVIDASSLIIDFALVMVLIFKFGLHWKRIKTFLHLLDSDMRISQIFTAYSLVVFICLYVIELASELIDLPNSFQWLVFGIFLALLLVNTGALYFLYDAVTARSDNKLLQAAAKAKEQYYADIELQQAHTSKVLHDYKNVLGALQLSLDQDVPTKSISQTHQLITDAQATLTQIQPNNAALTTITTLSLRSLLYLKWTQAHSHDIWLNIQTSGPIAIANNTDLMDSLRIVGILLDNAIEATATQGIIDILLVPATDELTITVINTVPADFKLARLNQIGYTTKGDNHGNGLANIRELTRTNHHLHMIKQLIDRKLSITLSIEVG